MYTYHIIAVETYWGETAIQCYSSNGVTAGTLFCIVRVAGRRGRAGIVDYGYETVEDAAKAWPDATLPEGYVPVLEGVVKKPVLALPAPQ